MFGAKQLIGAATALVGLTIGSGIALAAGAYAFGQDPGPSGWSGGSAYNYATQADAQNGAMSRCRSGKSGHEYCKIIATINGKCFAIAVQYNNNGYGWNTAATLPEAQRLAMDRCTSYGKSCSIRDAFCDTTTNSSAPPPLAAPEPAETPARNPSGGGSPACQKFPDLC